MLSQSIQGFMCVTKQVKPETPKTWLPSRSLLKSYTKLLYKFATSYMFDNNYTIDTWNIRREFVEYIIAPEEKTKNEAEGKRLCGGSLLSCI